MTTHTTICLPTAQRGGVRVVGLWMPASSLPRSSRRSHAGIVIGLAGCGKNAAPH